MHEVWLAASGYNPAVASGSEKTSRGPETPKDLRKRSLSTLPPTNSFWAPGHVAKATTPLSGDIKYNHESSSTPILRRGTFRANGSCFTCMTMSAGDGQPCGFNRRKRGTLSLIASEETALKVSLAWSGRNICAARSLNVDSSLSFLVQDTRTCTALAMDTVCKQA